jgi:hypothetical protein
MAMDSYGAKLTQRDVVDLAQASTNMAVVAETIRSSGVKWADATINLLLIANNSVVRIQNKGAAAFARYLEKHKPADPPLKAEISRLDDDLNQVRKKPPGEDEEG